MPNLLLKDFLCPKIQVALLYGLFFDSFIELFTVTNQRSMYCIVFLRFLSWIFLRVENDNLSRNSLNTKHFHGFFSGENSASLSKFVPFFRTQFILRSSQLTGFSTFFMWESAVFFSCVVLWYLTCVWSLKCLFCFFDN